MIKRDEMLKKVDDERLLFGLFISFSNLLQTVGDHFYEEITIKQFYLLICLSLFENEAPTINELSEIMGSTHQNVKQILNKLRSNGFIDIVSDNKDKRKSRVVRLEKLDQLDQKYQDQTMVFMNAFYEDVNKEEIKNSIQTLLKLERNLIEIKEKQ